MMVMLDFSNKGYVISNKQFKLEKKQEVMPFSLNRWAYFHNILQNSHIY